MEKLAIVHGVSGFGKSVKEAKAQAGAAIEKFVLQQHQPKLFKLGHYLGVVWIELIDGHGFVEWCYSLVDTRAERPSGPLHPAVGAGYAGWEKAERTMRLHAAQNLFSVDERADDGHGVLENEEDKHSHAGWCRWQRRYAEIKADRAPISDELIRQALQAEGF